MRYLVGALLFFQGVILLGQGLDYSVLTIPAELKENANSVIRQHEIIYRAESRSVATIYERKVITLLNHNHNK
jgi:hypothetical protein